MDNPRDRDIDSRVTIAKRTKSVNRLSTVHGHDLEQIRAAIEGLRFGVVQIIIQDGKIVQIDRTEKTRLV